MKPGHLSYESLLVRILLVAAILLTFCVGPAYSASEKGTITIVLSNEPNNLDPANNTMNNVGSVSGNNILESLTAINPGDSKILPKLATSWKQVDSNTWHFFLRKDVKFHDGEDFDARAVIFSIKRMYDKKIQSTTRDRYFFNFRTEAKALDRYTLELKTDKSVTLLPTLISTLSIASPNTPVDKWTSNPIGTGPYKLVKWDMGVQIIIERFDGYWGSQPEVKKAVYVWRSESSVRAAMVAIGEADIATNIAEQDANRPDMDYSYLNSETSALRIPGGNWEPPLSDRRVRLAFNYALDRDAVKSIFGKYVETATQLVPPTTFGYNPDLKPWPYDPAKAKQLLAEARKDGVPVDTEILIVCRVTDFPGSTEAAEVFMTMFRNVGLNVKIKFVETGVRRLYQYKPFAKGSYIFFFQHDNAMGDPAFTVRYMYGCDGAQSSVCDKELEDLVAKAESASGEERKNLWHKAFKRIHEEIVSNVFLFHMAGYTRVGKRINFKPSGALSLELQLYN